jgi:murein DD-endopeptidase MepM/ murein hydrolase activator NlpD
VKIAALPDSFIINCSDFSPPTENVVTSEYGPRWGRFHAGVDLRVKVGDSIRSAFDGKIRITKMGKGKKGYGYFVVIRHDNGLETLYGHLSRILVKPDQKVKAGEIIALGGNTGRSTGPHLHFEMRFLGNAFNPKKIIDFDRFVIYNDTYTINKKETFKELTAYVNNPARYYKVKSGDTLSKIAKNNRTTVSRLQKLNKLGRSTLIRPGQKIRVS